MLKLIIIEDEEILLSGLVRTVDWEEMGFRIVGTASDGEEGIALFEQTKPDVVLTDIKMPCRDGIEVLEEVKRRAPSTQVVLISGYREFAYAQKGITLDAYAYILKDALHEEIARVFPALREKLQKRENNRHYLQKLVSLQNYHQLLKGGSWASHLRAKFYGVVVVWCPAGAGALSEMSKTVSEPCCVLCLHESYLIITRCAQDAAEMEQWLEICLPRSLHTLARYAQQPGIVGIGGIKQTSAHILHSYQEAMKALDWGRIHHQQQVTRYTSLLPQLSRREKRPDIRPAQTAILLGKQKELIEFINALCLDSITSSNLFISDLQVLFNDIFMQFYRQFDEMGLDKQPILRLLGNAYTIDSYIDYNSWMIEQVSDLSARLEKGRRAQGAQDILRAVGYIDAHFSSPLRLEEIARLAYMTPAAFSSKMKEKTGRTFSEYIRDKRLKQACALLGRPDARVYEVARQCGYEDEKYFCRVFKMEYGISPRQYQLRACSE